MFFVLTTFVISAGYIYIRGEFKHEADVVEEAIAEAYAQGQPHESSLPTVDNL